VAPSVPAVIGGLGISVATRSPNAKSGRAGEGERELVAS
jgi:hypothetical protein